MQVMLEIVLLFKPWALA